jgi:hypothetical protein
MGRSAAEPSSAGLNDDHTRSRAGAMTARRRKNGVWSGLVMAALLRPRRGRVKIVPVWLKKNAK